MYEIKIVDPEFTYDPRRLRFHEVAESVFNGPATFQSVAVAELVNGRFVVMKWLNVLGDKLEVDLLDPALEPTRLCAVIEVDETMPFDTVVKKYNDGVVNADYRIAMYAVR